MRFDFNFQKRLEIQVFVFVIKGLLEVLAHKLLELGSIGI